MNTPSEALERIKAEAQRWVEIDGVKPGHVMCRWAQDRLATAEFLGEQLKRHASQRRDLFFGAASGFLTGETDWCPTCKHMPWPCPDAAAALALIAQLDGGT
jgi:hypothetical protein